MENNQNPKEYNPEECHKLYPNANEDYLCGIRYGVVLNPQICSECSKPFCKACIKEWLQKKNTCPFCLKESKFEESYHNFLLKMFKSQEVFCLFKEQDCGWKGQIVDL